MRVGIHASMYDQSTSKAVHAFGDFLDVLGEELCGDYGGIMEHLWIDLELIEAHAKPDGTARHPFRFQKRVSGRSHFGLPPAPDSLNVGHFSIRPDFALIRSLPADQAITYAVSLIYRGTEVLQAKSKRLGGFDADRFRSRFRDICRHHGHSFDG